MSKPKSIEPKAVDPENELNNALRTYLRLAPACSVAKRALGVPQLAPQEKQLGILRGEMQETTLCISMATKGRHALHDGQVKKYMRSALTEAEELVAKLRDEKAQLSEVSCLNYLSQKKLRELTKQVVTESDVGNLRLDTSENPPVLIQCEEELTNKLRKSQCFELSNIESALNRLKQAENRLELATKRFCVVNYENAMIRQEIHRLLVERKDFNIQWNRTINKLVKGKMFLLDIFEIAAGTFGDRDECCRMLDALKWKGLFGLNRDISEMQQFESELNHLTKLELFLRVKGSRRVCEAAEKEERMRLDEVDRCEAEIKRHDALLNEIFTYSDSDVISDIVSRFKANEIENFSKFQLLCQCLQESIITRSHADVIGQMIATQRGINEARVARENSHLEQLRIELTAAQQKTQAVRDANTAAENRIVSVLKGIEEITKISKCDISSLMSLLGPHAYATRWNVPKYLRILECDLKTLMQIAYSQVSPPTPARGAKQKGAVTKVVADPCVVTLRPNRIGKLVTYQPCAYCVEDYMMNQVFETPATVATDEYVDMMLNLEKHNTQFGLYTLTIPAKRHPFKGTK